MKVFSCIAALVLVLVPVHPLFAQSRDVRFERLEYEGVLGDSRQDPPILAVAFSLKNRDLLTVCSTEGVAVWNLRTKEKTALLSQQNTGAILIPGASAVLSDTENSFSLWTLGEKHDSKKFPGHIDTIYAIAVTADGKTLATGSGDKSIKVWDLVTGQLRFCLTKHCDKVLSLAFSPDGRLLASGGADKTISIWRMDTGFEVAVLQE